ncbi:hypothetical protein PGB90_010208 [Kerria lacca]
MQSWNSSNKAIKTNCEFSNLNNSYVDAQLFIPVTNIRKNITYKNLFCAICNGETEFEFWHVGFLFYTSNGEQVGFDTISQKINETNANEKLTLSKILSYFQLNSADNVLGSLTVNNITYLYSMYGKIPPTNLPKSITYCTTNKTESCRPNDTTIINVSLNYTSNMNITSEKRQKISECLLCSNESGRNVCKIPNTDARILATSINDPIVRKKYYCKDIPYGNKAFNILCPETIDPDAPCIYTKRCYIAKSYNVSFGLRFINNVTIYIDEYKIEYPNSEFFKLINGSIFVCGSYLPHSTWHNIFSSLNFWISEILIKISIFCLILHLLCFLRIREMRNLTGKNLSCFCFTLLISFLCLEIGPILPRRFVVVTAILSHFSLINCFVWLLIMSYDCWLSIYRATKNFRSAGGKHVIKFLVYCSISLLVPIIIVGVSLYYEFAPPSVISCSIKPGYGKSGEYFITESTALIKFFIIPATFIFLCNIAFFTHTALMIYQSQRNTVNPNSRNDFQLYVRLALMMGLSWILGSLSSFTSDMIVELFYNLFNMSQGIFIFFYFTFKKFFIKSITNRYTNNFVTRILSNLSSNSTVETESTPIEDVQKGVDIGTNGIGCQLERCCRIDRVVLEPLRRGGYDGFFILEKFILGFGGPQFLPVGEFDLMEEIFNIIYELRVEWGEKRSVFSRYFLQIARKWKVSVSFLSKGRPRNLVDVLTSKVHPLSLRMSFGILYFFTEQDTGMPFSTWCNLDIEINSLLPGFIIV